MADSALPLKNTIQEFPSPQPTAPFSGIMRAGTRFQIMKITFGEKCKLKIFTSHI